METMRGSPFWDLFGDFFFEKFSIALFLGKILVANYRIVCDANFAPKAQNFSTDIRKSAVLDAVLEDKPAQPLPCGSYLVKMSCFERFLVMIRGRGNARLVQNLISGKNISI